MPRLAIVADDLTGAADTAACFADAGYVTVVPLAGGSVPEADVLALSTESRDLDAAAAARVIFAAVVELETLPSARPRWIYKKIDSALRGHPREELLAAMDAAGETRTLVAPALPAEGRTTRDGRQCVGGLPLEASGFGGPGAISDLTRVFANDRGWPVHRIELADIRRDSAALARDLDADSPGILIADAETDDDLRAIAQAVSRVRVRVICGSAGLARQLALTLPMPPLARLPLAAMTRDRPILVVAGSRHETTARQIAALGHAGAAIIRLEQQHLDDPDSAMAGVTARVMEYLARGRDTVVTTVGLKRSSAGERVVAARLAEVATAPAVHELVGGMILTGGDVAAAVCAGLGATAIRLGGEIAAGQPWGVLMGGALPGLPVATKAGSFGSEDALIGCVGFLRGVASG